MNNFGRINRIALNSHLTTNNGKMLVAKRFGHGPPTRYGIPHYWGGMVWGPRLWGIWGTLIAKYGLFGFLIWKFGASHFPYPAHKYNMQNNMGRMW